jgi:hypothetical protein
MDGITQKNQRENTRKRPFSGPLGDGFTRQAGCGLEDREINTWGEIGRNNMRDEREEMAGAGLCPEEDSVVA